MLTPSRPDPSPVLRRRPLIVAAGLAGVAAMTLAGCASGTKNDPKKSAGDPHTLNVSITAAKGCEMDGTRFAAGGLTVNVANKDATAVSEVEILDGGRIIGEKENLPPGFNGTFAVNLQAGSYTLYCPGAATEKATLTVTGKSVASNTDVAALLTQATTGYAAYVNTQVGYLLDATKKLNGALAAGNLVAAQKAYIEARPFYEKIEPVAESFTVGSDSLDADIDARANDVPAADWKGFHKIEKGLFQDRSMSGLSALGTQLVGNVVKLQSLVKTLKYQPTELANGAQELLDEVATGKITGEEERYSHIDLLDMAYNIEGSEQAFAQLKPALQKIAPDLASTLTTRFAALDTVVDKYRDPKAVSGFVLYGTLTDADRRALSDAVQAVQEPLSQVASKVAGQS